MSIKAIYHVPKSLNTRLLAKSKSCSIYQAQNSNSFDIRACLSAMAVLNQGGSSVQAVTEAIKQLEVSLLLSLISL